MRKFMLILLAFLLTAAMVCTLAACNDDPTEPPHTHDYGTLIPETPADCGTNGTRAHYKCDGCNKLFVDDNGEKKEVLESELVIPATGQHDYADQSYVSGGASGHHQLCKVCGTPNTDVPHADFTYTPVAGQRQHTKKCGVCNYEVTENCTVEDNECTLCHADYTPVVGGDETITVHFHPTEWWNADELKLYVWYGSGDGTVYLLGAFPGTSGFQADATNAGWYTYTFQVPQGHRGTDLYLIVNDKVSTGEDTYDGVQTGNIAVTATELWIAGIVNTEQFYATSQEAEAAEADIPGKDEWIIVGSFADANWQNPATNLKYVFKQADGYKLTFEFAAGAAFKVTKNGSWDNAIGYDSMTYTAEDTVTGDTSKLFTQGQENDYNNIIINYACTLEITLTPSTSAIAIKIVEATGLPEIDDTNVTKYYLVGEYNGKRAWDDDSGDALTYDSDTQTYSITVSFKVGDQWKVKKESAKPKPTNDPSWDYGINAGDMATKFTFNYGSITQPSKPLFEGSDNITVNHNCTVTITYKPSNDTTVITVTALTENKESYTYTFYFYAGSSRSKMQIHAWSNEPTGAPQFGTDWNGSEMENVSGYWWKWSITSSVNWDGKEFSVIFHIGDTKIQWLNTTENKVSHDTKVYLAREMYFIDTDYTQWFESAEAAGHPMTVAAVAPVQVATVPQSIRKSYLDYALAA